ncbi:hypothetical protein [Bradyrhizobium ivorense]|uniref:hypothetical protein n=1 Tax=Bradyrhizobium ivorense TaxID=2511166 RepID=UPI00155AC85F|nr:hypothetical protein [Bradyrhizobium ivorense]
MAQLYGLAPEYATGKSGAGGGERQDQAEEHSVHQPSLQLRHSIMADTAFTSSTLR